MNKSKKSGGTESLRSLENGEKLLFDSFASLSGDWKEIYLKGVELGGSYNVSNGRLVVGIIQSNSIYGVYHSAAVCGHFYAEVEFDADNACGLALIQEKDSSPDPENFTLIGVSTNSEKKVVVQVSDRQNRVDDVLDNTRHPGIYYDRYEHLLDNEYSVPYTSTNKKIRIFRDDPAGFFHFYYTVKKMIRGEWTEGWMELAPSKDWGAPGQNYYVALVVRSGEAPSAQVKFDNVRVMQKSTKDRDDTKTGFKATRREYNWSGFFGDAVVITFGNDFDYCDSDCKFVFWSGMNYIPAWHMNNQLLYTYEFLETWGGGVEGCHEPMSDRLLRWSSVEILEDNDVRKVVHWHYVLCNPDYKVPNDDVGTQLPEGDEYWTFYPDGTGIRYIVYTPRLDSSHREWHEMSELIVIAGSLTNPSEHLASPALTVLNLEGNVDTYHPGRTLKKKTNEWNQVIMSAHFKSAPDAFNVFSHAKDIPETYSHYQIGFDISWHDTRFQLCHWPVGLEPYQKVGQTPGTWKAQVSHTCLMGVGVYGGTDWNDHYKVDERGRRYRDWISLVGLNEPGDLDSLRAKTKTWLYPGSITMLDSNSQFEEINYKQKELIFTNTADNQKCYFTLDPTPKSTTVINPVFKIENWGNHSVEVMVNNDRLKPGVDFQSAIEGNAAVIWVKAQFNSPTTFKIQASNTKPFTRFRRFK